MQNPFRRRKALSASSDVLSAIEGRQWAPVRPLGGTNQRRIAAAWEMAQSQTYAWLYQTQPSVRTVVDFIARNLSQLGLKLYERVGDDERKRQEDHPAAQTMRYPFELTPEDRWIFDFVADFLIYDNAYAVKFRGASDRRTLLRIPPHQMSIEASGQTVDGFRIHQSDGTVVPDYDLAPLSPEQVIHWRGYNPDDPRVGWSKLETLREVLAEDAASQKANTELLKSGLMKPGWVYTPLEAPTITDQARQAAEIDLFNRLSRKDRRPPWLEEGREIRDLGITPKDAEMLAGRRFTLETVCQQYGLPLGLFTSEGDIEEQRKLIYADVLPPYAKSLQCVLDKNLLEVEYGADDFYFEFDLNEKLRGDPQARFAALTAATGRPWLTVDEARTKENLPQIEGGDELTIPLNVSLAGDQGDTSKPQLPAPNVMPPQNPNGNPQDGSYREQSSVRIDNQVHKALETSTTPRVERDVRRQRRYESEMRGTFERFFNRQLRTLYSQKGKFDSNRWNRELAEDLKPRIRSIIEREASVYAAHLGGEFDPVNVENYVASTAAKVAEQVNAATQRDFEGERTGREALERASGQRAAIAGTTLGSRLTRVARQEGAKASPRPEGRMQTWIADTDRHAELDGVSVPLGATWGGIEPGSEPNCACSVAIS